MLFCYCYSDSFCHSWAHSHQCSYSCFCSYYLFLLMLSFPVCLSLNSLSCCCYSCQCHFCLLWPSVPQGGTAWIINHLISWSPPASMDQVGMLNAFDRCCSNAGGSRDSSPMLFVGMFFPSLSCPLPSLLLCLMFVPFHARCTVGRCSSERWAMLLRCFSEAFLLCHSLYFALLGGFILYCGGYLYKLMFDEPQRPTHHTVLRVMSLDRSSTSSI